MNFPLIWREWLLATAASSILCLLVCLYRKLSFKRSLAWTSFVMYSVTLVCLTLLPFPEQEAALTLSDLLDNIVWTPFLPILESWSIVAIYLGRGDLRPLYTFLWNHVGNLLVLMPLALFLYNFFRFRFLVSFSLSFIGSLMIESLQAVFCLYFGVFYRVVDINDIILNTVGALIALAIAASIRLLLSRRRQ